MKLFMGSSSSKAASASSQQFLQQGENIEDDGPSDDAFDAVSFVDSDHASGSSGDGANAKNHHREEERETIAKQETKAVFRLKLLVLLLLTFFAVGTALAVFYYTTGSEQDQFEDQFKDDAHKVLEAVGSSLDKTFGAFDSLAVAAVSYARSTNQTWPNVTLPDFGMRAAKVLELSDGVITVNICPFVTPEQRAGWEEYASVEGEHIYWVNETLMIQETWKNYYGPINQYNWTGYDIIHGDFDDVPYNSTRLMMPNWQGFPQVLVVCPNAFEPIIYNYKSHNPFLFAFCRMALRQPTGIGIQLITVS